MKRFLAFLIFALSSAALQANLLTVQANSLKEYREVRYVMGTLLDITLYHHDAQEARKSFDEAFSLGQRLDGLLSNYQAQSEVNQLNQKAGQGKVKISAELYNLIERAKSLSQRTGGAFDITVGPLMFLWREAQKSGQLPSTTSIRAAQSLVGIHHVILYPSLEAELSRKGMQVDTGGIGKGYAVDKIVQLFRIRGITSALINFGHSSIYALGAPLKAQAWKLLIQFPGQSPLGILELKDQALSASNSLGSSFEIAGREYGHIIDPRTGIPVTQRIQTVVLTPSATEGEALSKYVILEGWKKGENQKTWGKVQVMRIGEAGKTSDQKISLSNSKQALGIMTGSFCHFFQTDAPHCGDGLSH